MVSKRMAKSQEDSLRVTTFVQTHRLKLTKYHLDLRKEQAFQTGAGYNHC